MKILLQKRIKMRTITSFLIVSAGMLTLGQNCGDFKSQEPTIVKSGAMNLSSSNELPAGPQPTPVPSMSRNEQAYGPRAAIRDYEPTLAVRGTACLMCHASVIGNVITDFGYGSPYFFNKGFNSPYANWYGDWPGNWGSSILSSKTQVYVPRAGTADILGGIATLASYIKSQVPNTTVNEVSQVYIGAPTAARVREVGHLTNGVVKTFAPRGRDSAPFTGIDLDGSKKYFTNGKDPIVCDGDLALDGVLWLNNAKILTYHGCHIYTTGTVFVTGPINYADVDSQSVNLQISSARAIYMGIGHPCNGRGGWDDSYTTRIVQGALHPDAFVTRESSVPNQLLKAIQDDADRIGTKMQDATCGPEGRNVGFLHMVLNAPVFQSRYQGVFTGSVIAEIGLAPRDDAHMAFDPVFKTLPVLPLLKDEELIKVAK